jgi:glycerol-3-phosphate acyltransferase PlsY
MILSVIGLLIAYFLGAIPFGYLLAKYWANIDILKSGSGNIGATNALRTMGKKAGAAVLILDLLKGFVAVAVISRVFYQEGIGISMLAYIYLAGALAVSGHIWTIFLKFKGGKGVSTTLGVLIGLTTFDLSYLWILLAAFLIWFVIVYITKYVSLGSISASLVLLVGLSFYIENLSSVIFGIFIAAIVIYSHRSNILRLIKGDESRIKF